MKNLIWDQFDLDSSMGGRPASTSLQKHVRPSVITEPVQIIVSPPATWSKSDLGFLTKSVKQADQWLSCMFFKIIAQHISTLAMRKPLEICVKQIVSYLNVIVMLCRINSGLV